MKLSSQNILFAYLLQISMSVPQTATTVTQMLLATTTLEVSCAIATMDSQEMEYNVIVCLMSGVRYLRFQDVVFVAPYNTS